MRILVLNAGSSSLKFGVFDPAQSDTHLFKGEFSGFSPSGAELQCRSGQDKASASRTHAPATSIEEAARELPALLLQHGIAAIDAVGHRIVHGGTRFRDSVLASATVMQELQACSSLAPLHTPAALAVLRHSRQCWPDLPQVAVFDTAFHHTIPDYASTYAVPHEWRARGLRRYGFHGTSHHYVMLRTAAALATTPEQLRLVSCHLGNGASVCAINHGISVDTSMGMTPLEGLVMGTRAGDVDPGLFSFLQRELGLDAIAIEQRLNNDSGLQALAGTSDLAVIEQRAARGDTDAQLAIRLYAYRVRKYIGAYAAAMGGLDAVVFTGGIGENSADMRRRICERLEFLGLLLDDDRNRAPDLRNSAAPQIQAADSRVRVLVTRANEQYMIAREVQSLLQKDRQHGTAVQIPVAVSARHVHLSQAAVEALFGTGHQLTLAHTLSQPEGWAAQETVELIGPGGSFRNVRVLGPTRPATQIEVSRTDTFTLGIDAPLRDSGQLADTPQVRLRGPAGRGTCDKRPDRCSAAHPHESGRCRAARTAQWRPRGHEARLRSACHNLCAYPDPDQGQLRHGNAH